MKKSVVGNPDPFGLSPLLALLPERPRVLKDKTAESSLFARYENVTGLQEAEQNPEVARRYSAEAQMLRLLLERYQAGSQIEGAE